MAAVALGAFELHAPIGRGGMGVIWSATHRPSQLPVAVKVLTVARAADETFRTAFRREVRAVAALDHPNIVQVYDYGTVDAEAEARSERRLVAGTPWLAMELVQGGSLARVRGKMPWPDLRRALLDLLGALAHAHARGVVHRDIKPGNILLRHDGTLELTDFGLAHALQDERPDDDPARRGGTPAYMAPEQFQAAWRDYGPWTDLYALGCTAWALTAGRPPFHGGTWVDIMHGHLRREIGPLDVRVAVPDGFEDWLRRLLRRSPRQRFRRAADAAWALLQLPEEAPDTPAPPVRPPVGEGQGTRTTLFWTAGELPARTAAEPALVPDAPPEEDAPPREIPPLPLSAQPPETPRRSLLRGAGLGLYGLRTIPLVGRERQRTQLWEALREVHESRRLRVVTVQGPVGSGKSRLAEWLVQRAHEVGAANVLAARHGPVPGPAEGLSRMVATHLGCVGLTGDDLRERLTDLLAAEGVDDPYEWQALAEVIDPTHAGPRLLTSPRQRYVLLRRLLARAAAERPVVLWLDDVQWSADALGLVEHLLGQGGDLPILVLLTAREGPLGGHSGELGRLQLVSARPETTSLSLGNLAPTETAALVRELLGLRGELADQVEARSAGSPLFAVQLVGDWVGRGLLEPTERGFRLDPSVRIQVPDDLHALWTEALDPVLARAPAGAREALELAAALGIEVDAVEWGHVCALAGLPAPSDLADDLVEARLLRADEEAWIFVHAMLRESVERSAREGGRWEHHNRVCAAMLADRYPAGTAVVAGRLGRHLLEAGAHEEALDLLLQGVTAHRESSEYREALELLDRRHRALDGLALPEHDPTRLVGWLERARVYLQQGRPHLAGAWAERAAAAADAADSPRLAALAHCRLADVHRHRGRIVPSERRYHAGLAGFRALDDWEGVGDCLAGLGQLAERRGRYDRARELFEEARAAYAAVNAPLQVATCIDGLAQAARQLGELGRARALAEESLARFQGLGNLSGIARARRRLAQVLRLQGRYDEAAAQHREALRLYENTGDLAGQHDCINGLAEIARYTGDLVAAEAGYRRATELGEAIELADRILPRANLALVVLRRGRYAEARVMLEEVVEEAEAGGRRALLGGLHMALVASAAGLGDVSTAELHFRLGRALLDETGSVDPDVAWPAELAGELLCAAGHPDWARAAWELALFQWKGLGAADDAGRVKAVLQERFGRR